MNKVFQRTLFLLSFLALPCLAVAADSLQGRWGLALGGGWSPGTRSESLASSDFHPPNLTADWGSGLAWDAELRYGIGENTELGLGLGSPLGYDQQGDGDWRSYLYGGWYRYEARMKAWPVLASLRQHVAVSGPFSVYLGVASGWFGGGQESARSNYDTDGLSAASQAGNASVDYAGGVAYGAVAGAEYQVAPWLSVELGAKALAYPLTATRRETNHFMIDTSGNVSDRRSEVLVYKDAPAVSRPAAYTTVSALDGSGTGTVTDIVDSGSARSVRVVHYVSNNPQSSEMDDYSERALTTDWKLQLSAMLSLVFRY